MNVERDYDRDRWPRLVLGLALCAAGVIFALGQLGRIDARQYMAWWPLALVAVGGANVLHRRYVAAAIWTSIGIYLLLPLLGFARFPFWRIFAVSPLVISAAGVTLALQAIRGTAVQSGFRAVAVMGGNMRSIGSDEFRGGEVVAVMGGCEIDLTRAKIAGEATIEVLALWGGIEIRVPEGWRIEDRVVQILGGFEDKTSAPVENGPRLVIRGSSIMAGVEVKSGERRT